jgi:DNA-binding MarR family transcriptional regulator
MDLSTCIKGVQYLQEAFSRRFQLQQIHVFLVIADRGTVSMDQLVEATGLTKAAVSRNVKLLREYMAEQRDGTYKKEGYGYVEVSIDPYDPRAYVIKLTVSGRAVAEEIWKIGLKASYKRGGDNHAVSA